MIRNKLSGVMLANLKETFYPCGPKSCQHFSSYRCVNVGVGSRGWCNSFKNNTYQMLI